MSQSEERPRSRVCADGVRRGASRPKIPKKKCLTPDCEGVFGADDKPGGRGLCWKCHLVASRMVKRGPDDVGGDGVAQARPA